MYVPPMGAEGWFDASVAQSDEKFAGIAITFSGFLFIGVFVTLICAMIPRIVRAAKEKQTAINNIQTATIDNHWHDLFKQLLYLDYHFQID